MPGALVDLSYFPGCSLATTARENDQSLRKVCAQIGFRLVEIEDWNCCGSSSAHSINADLAFHLACRNLSLAPPGRPLLVACPSCIIRLRSAHYRLKQDTSRQVDYERRWGRPPDADLNIIHFFELMDANGHPVQKPAAVLNGLRFAPYYGCMLAQPPELRHEKSYRDLMEKLLHSYGAESVLWSYHSRCCGTYLSVARPDVAEPMVNRIIQGALDAGAECIVTACAMCHLNLEIRCGLKNKLPIFHFSELLSLALRIPVPKSWFAKHLVDPMPLLAKRGIL
ncbi:MAG: heterodisulfide reductase subunit B [Desulfobacteraceae bacterium]|nr:MAG: heterodisulfide reductase subunit B [Desulfobacteraceae bacterium]